MTTMNVTDMINDMVTLIKSNSPFTTNLGGSTRIEPIWAIFDEGVNVVNNPTFYVNGRLQPHMIVRPGLVFSSLGIESVDVIPLTQNIEFWFYSAGKYKTILDAVPLLSDVLHGQTLVNGGLSTHYRDFYPETIGDLESQKIIRCIYEVNGIREVV